METQQAPNQARDQAPGETFRRGISRALEALDKLTFLPPDLKESITANAAKLCLAEALAEQKAQELGKEALSEWQAQAPQLKAQAQRFIDELFPKTTQKTPNASADKAADSPQTPPSADAKPEA
jgi:hypothetical protein